MLICVCINIYFSFMETPLVGIIMGSDSDLKIMSQAAEIFEKFNIPFEISVISGHRTPKKTFEYSQTARKRGLKVIIAGAGGAAHLAGMTAALTTLPVIGVPIKGAGFLDGWDSLLATVQMPPGIPVATVATDGGRNAGILAVQIIGTSDPKVAEALDKFKEELAEKVESATANLHKIGYKKYLEEKGAK